MKEEKNSGNQSLIRGLRLIDLLSHYPNGCPLISRIIWIK